MSPEFKWIGVASLGVALFFAAALVGGQALEAEASAGRAALAQDEADPLARAFGPAPKTELAEASAPVPAPHGAFVIKRVLPIEGPIKYGEWYWDEAGVPEGPLVITIDLEARVLSVFRDGYEIGAAAVLLGTPEFPTPTGRFPILSKERNNVSEKYDDAPMPWTLRLTWDGIAIHGGHAVELGYASHGCIGSPDKFAAKLFAAAQKGDLVIVTDGKRTGVGQSLVS